MVGFRVSGLKGVTSRYVVGIFFIDLKEIGRYVWLRRFCFVVLRSRREVLVFVRFSGLES